MFEAITGLIPGVAGVAGVLGAGYGIWKKRNLAKLVKAVFDVIQECRGGARSCWVPDKSYMAKRVKHVEGELDAKVDK